MSSLDDIIDTVSGSRIGRFASRVGSWNVPIVSSAGRLFLHAQYGFYFPGDIQEKYCSAFGYSSTRLSIISLAEGVFLNGFRAGLCMWSSSPAVREFTGQHSLDTVANAGTLSLEIYTALSIAEYAIRTGYIALQRKGVDRTTITERLQAGKILYTFQKTPGYLGREMNDVPLKGKIPAGYKTMEMAMEKI